MRLINTSTLLLEEFYDSQLPRYAILSHTWEDEEVTFQDWQNPELATQKKGFSKIKGACDLAVEHHMGYLWVDTNCIDKTSSAELSEAINSMFRWYRNSNICFAYLSDVESCSTTEDSTEAFIKSKWFTRGWTLQELLAPERLIFYARDWSQIGHSWKLVDEISEATSIDKFYFMGILDIEDACVARKMSWLSRRQTTRVEDMAYCMLGLFDINMPLLYGEGSKAFVRLQEEIIKVTNDHSIFYWVWMDSVPNSWVSMLAPSPDVFQFSGGASFTPPPPDSRTFSITNAGLSIKLPILYTGSYYLAVLNVTDGDDYAKNFACIPIQGDLIGDDISSHDYGVVQRKRFPPCPLFVPMTWEPQTMPLLVRANRGRLLRKRKHDVWRRQKPSRRTVKEYKFLLVFNSIDTGSNTGATGTRWPRFKLNSDTDRKWLQDTVSYPEYCFDIRRSLVTLHGEKGQASGAILKIGQDFDQPALIFLGCRYSSESPVLFCGVLEPKAWGTKEDLNKLLGELLEVVEKNEMPKTRAKRSDLTVEIGDDVDMVSSRIAICPTLITRRKLRLHLRGSKSQLREAI